MKDCRKKNRNEDASIESRLICNKDNQILWRKDYYYKNWLKISKLKSKKRFMKKGNIKLNSEALKKFKKLKFPCTGLHVYDIPDKLCLNCPTKKCRYQYIDELGWS